MFFEDAAAKNFTFGMDGRDPWAQRWKRYIANKKNAEQAKEYNTLESDTLKAEFRQAWCKGKYAEHQDHFQNMVRAHRVLTGAVSAPWQTYQHVKVEGLGTFGVAETRCGFLWGRSPASGLQRKLFVPVDSANNPKWVCKAPQETKTKRVTISETHAEEGTYLPFACIVTEEGGGVAGTKAACNYILRCLELKGKYLYWDDFTRRVKFLYVKRTWRSAFSRAWEQHATWKSDVIRTGGWGSGPSLHPSL